MSSSARSASVPIGTERPPTWARDRPSAPTTRLSSNVPSSRSPPSHRAGRDRPPARGPDRRRSAREPERTRAASQRPPKSKPSPVTTIVFPAPVSPVTTVKPGDRSSTASSMTPRPLMRSSSSTFGCYSGRRTPPRHPRTGRPNFATNRSVNGPWFSLASLSRRCLRSSTRAPATSSCRADRRTIPCRRRHQDLHRKGRVRRDDHRSSEQRVRVERHDQQAHRRRATPPGHPPKTRRRSIRWRRQHHPITAELRHRPAVDLDNDVNHAFAQRLFDRRFVERPASPHDLVADEDFDIESQAFFDLVVVLGDPAHRAARLADSASARNPMWPRLTPSNGTSASRANSAARNRVPSPPRTMTASTTRALLGRAGTTGARAISSSAASDSMTRTSIAYAARKSATSRAAAPPRGGRCDRPAARFLALTASRLSWRGASAMARASSASSSGAAPPQPKEILHVAGRPRKWAGHNGSTPEPM